MKRLTLLTTVLLAGCGALPVPATKISYQPESRAIAISSPKDVKIGKIDLLSEGTNFTLTITDYKSSNPIEVIKAAAGAQKVQVQGGLDALDRIITAAGK